MGGPILVAFGAQSPVGVRSSGLEIGTEPGAVVISPTNGQIDFAGELTGEGLLLIVRTAGGDHLVLSGLGTLAVDRGQEVAAGAKVGEMPAGPGARPRLYFELRRGLTPVDPAPFLVAPRR